LLIANLQNATKGTRHHPNFARELMGLHMLGGYGGHLMN
jgi:uncharacterized protein (DUF1800 family)